jgi:hypothetical protein
MYLYELAKTKRFDEPGQNVQDMKLILGWAFVFTLLVKEDSVETRGWKSW